MYKNSKVYDKFQVLSKIEKQFYEICFMNKQKILELACGSGRIGEIFNSSNYVGVDLSHEMLKSFKLKCENKSLIQANVTALPLIDKYDGIVFSLNSIHHLNTNELSLLILELERLSSDDCLLLIEMSDFEKILWVDGSYENEYSEFSSGKGLLLKQKITKEADFYHFERRYFEKGICILKEVSKLYPHNEKELSFELERIGFKKNNISKDTSESSNNQGDSRLMLLYQK
ncbi:MAG: hypothetical protein COB02_18530 [Candidatus Cloacimonadota bacterium]|nr:MAG: hypothetical protein COB02_18530 [Candidatus Cloacimonadota bacterium]